MPPLLMVTMLARRLDAVRPAKSGVVGAEAEQTRHDDDDDDEETGCERRTHRVRASLFRRANALVLTEAPEVRGRATTCIIALDVL